MDLPSVDRGETLDHVLAEIGKGQIFPCYLLYGDEEYLIQNALDRIIDCLLPAADREFNLFYVEGEQEDGREGQECELGCSHSFTSCRLFQSCPRHPCN